MARQFQHADPASEKNWVFVAVPVLDVEVSLIAAPGHLELVRGVKRDDAIRVIVERCGAVSRSAFQPPQAHERCAPTPPPRLQSHRMRSDARKASFAACGDLASALFPHAPSQNRRGGWLRWRRRRRFLRRSETCECHGFISPNANTIGC